MFFLRKMHIGEVQASLWGDDDLKILKDMGINIL